MDVVQHGLGLSDESSRCEEACDPASLAGDLRGTAWERQVAKAGGGEEGQLVESYAVEDDEHSHPVHVSPVHTHTHGSWLTQMKQVAPNC